MSSYNLNVPEFTTLLYDTNSNVMQLHVSYYITENSNYKIIRYNKDILYVEHTFGVFRSVVVNNENQIVSFAPPKSLSIEKFTEMNPTKTDNIVAEEFVEGTMINVFWDGQLNAWNIATRNTIGANVYFFKTESKKTFNRMFYEALSNSKLDLNNLNKSYCYSFVLQHPENRIVVPISRTAIYLVQVYKITGNVVDVLPMETVHSDEVWKNTEILFPTLYSDWNHYSELVDRYASQNTDYRIMGVVIKNTETNERCKIRNPVYEEIRHLKGNQPKLQYHYLSLRKNGKISEYLKFYPECKKKFSKFRDELHVFTNTLFANYVSCYIKKEKPLIEFSGQYRTHMFKLHKIYLEDLKDKLLNGQKQFITITTVINYVNSLHESQQMNALHYHLKKQYIDTVKADADMETNNTSPV
jgi:hypothetical protein